MYCFNSDVLSQCCPLTALPRILSLPETGARSLGRFLRFSPSLCVYLCISEPSPAWVDLLSFTQNISRNETEEFYMDTIKLWLRVRMFHKSYIRSNLFKKKYLKVQI